MMRLAVILTKERKLDVLWAVDPKASHTYCAAEKRELCGLWANDPLRTLRIVSTVQKSKIETI